MDIQKKERLYKALCEPLTERKIALFDTIASQRTNYVSIVLEDLYQAQNISAVMRSAESWGIQQMHVVENTHHFQHHRRIARGANDWINIHRYNRQVDNSLACFEKLKSDGFQILTTALHENSITLDEVDLSKKTAVVLGTELSGASRTAMEMCDHTMIIPMFGFTESLNVSVAGSVIMQNLTSRLRSENRDWQLSYEEQLDLKIAWAKKSIYWSQYIVDMFEQNEI